MTPLTHPIPRRSFLSATACAVLCEFWPQSAPAQAAEISLGRVRVGLADFPSLATVHGSVHVNVAAAPPGLYPVVVTRTGSETFAAVSSECAHNGCVVPPFSTELGLIQCNCHGSQYTAQGVVVRGPAQRNLTAYPVRRLGTLALELEIPGIGFALTGAVITGAAGSRLRLAFPTVAGLRYAVRLRGTLGGADAPASFSLTESGGFDQPSVLGSGATAVIFLPTPTGQAFYAMTRD